MMPPRSSAPTLVLTFCWVLLCAPQAFAAAEVPPPVQPLYGDYLSGIVAGSLGDADIASTRLLDVLRIDPGDAALRNKAFVFSTLAGSSAAATLAPQVGDSPLAALVLGNAAARAGDWTAAQTRYKAVPASPLNDLLRPLLVAWSQQGAGQTDLALATLAPYAQAGPIGGFYALHAAMIADLAGRMDQAGRLYQQALSLYPGSDLVFVQSYASFLARTGKQAQATALVHDLVRALPLLAIAERGLDASLSSAPIANAVQGLAVSI